MLWGWACLVPVVALAQFPVTRTVPTSSLPDAIALADLDHDGLPDLITDSGTRVEIHAGRGDLRFRFPKTVLVEDDPTAFDVGDVDADGRTDLVWVARGSGNFGLVRQLPTVPATYLTLRRPGPDEPEQVRLFDLDGDGKQDAVVSHRGADQLTVYRNLGLGDFGPAETVDIGDGPTALALDRWDAGSTVRIGVVQAGVLSDDVGIYDAAFQPIQVLPIPRATSVHPLAWDTGPYGDLLITRGDGRVHVYLGQPNGGYLPGPSWPAARGAAQAEVLFSDPGAGHRLLLLESDRNRVSVQTTDPGGVVGDPRSFYVGPDIDRFTLGDADGDGRREAYFPARLEAQVVILEEDDDGGWEGFPSVVSGRLPAQIEHVPAMAGLPERLAVLCITDAEIWIYERSDQILAPTQVLPVAPDALRFRWGDMDGDGRPDLVSVGDTTGVEVHLADGAGFAPPTRHPVAGSPRDLEILAYGADAWPDILVADRDVVGVRILEADGQGGYQDIGVFQCSDNPTRLLAEDLDLDGRDDLILVGEANKVCFAFNDLGGFQASSTFQVGDQPRGVAVGRIVDDDPYPDIVIGNAGDNTFTVFTSIFPRIYALSTQEQEAPSGTQAAVMADLNGGGVDDLAFCSPASGRIGVHFNSGGGVFTQAQRVRSSSLPLDLATMDIDGNGWPDLVVLDGLGDSLVLLLNREDQVAPGVVAESPTSVPSAPVRLQLEPPYPNPGMGPVHFRVRAEGAAPQLEIFDLRGRRVRSLTLRAIGGAGFLSTWSGRDDRGTPVARGRYVARLSAGTAVATRSLVLR